MFWWILSAFASSYWVEKRCFLQGVCTCMFGLCTLRRRIAGKKIWNFVFLISPSPPPPPFVPSLPNSNPSLKAQIPASSPKSQPRGRNPSLEAQTPTLRLTLGLQGCDWSLGLGFGPKGQEGSPPFLLPPLIFWPFFKLPVYMIIDKTRPTPSSRVQGLQIDLEWLSSP